MLYLGWTGSSILTVTLYDKCQNVYNPYFTWQLIDKDSNEEYIFTSDDFSHAPYYWNTFTVSVSGVVGLTAGIIDIPQSQYRYNVYEMANPYDLNLSNAIGLVENGLLTVIGSYSQIQSYTASSNTTEVYRNQNRI